jgi:hypothetical protein
MLDRRSQSCPKKLKLFKMPDIDYIRTDQNAIGPYVIQQNATQHYVLKEQKIHCVAIKGICAECHSVECRGAFSYPTLVFELFYTDHHSLLEIVDMGKSSTMRNLNKGNRTANQGILTEGEGSVQLTSLH